MTSTPAKPWEQYSPKNLLTFLKSVEIEDRDRLLSIFNSFNTEWAKHKNDKFFTDVSEIIDLIQAFYYKLVAEGKVGYALLVKLCDKILSHVSMSDFSTILALIGVAITILIDSDIPELIPFTLILEAIQAIVMHISPQDILNIIRWIEDFNKICIKEASKLLSSGSRCFKF